MVIRVLILYAEQLAFGEQLFDAALGELWVVARGAALFDRWGFQRGARLWAPSVPGVLLVVTVGTLWWVALLRRLPSLLVRLSQRGGWCLILLLGLILSAPGGLVGLFSRFSVHHFGLLPGCMLWIKSRGSKSADVQRVWRLELSV